MKPTLDQYILRCVLHKRIYIGEVYRVQRRISSGDSLLLNLGAPGLVEKGGHELGSSGSSDFVSGRRRSVLVSGSWTSDPPFLRPRGKVSRYCMYRGCAS